MPIRTLLVDDNRSYLKAIKVFLNTQPWIEIIGHALSGSEALEIAALAHPDLALVDWIMPEMNGLETTQRLKLLDHPPRVIILTLHENSIYRQAAVNAGADGFLSKADVGVKFFPLVRSLFKLYLY